MKDDYFQTGRDFLTRELVLATVLSYFSHSIKKIEWDRRAGIAYFIVPMEEKTEKIIEDFQKGKLKVEPREFNNRMRDLKRMIFEVKDRN